MGTKSYKEDAVSGTFALSEDSGEPHIRPMAFGGPAISSGRFVVSCTLALSR